MRYAILETGEHLPNGCTLCHTHEGPFVHLIGVKFMDVATENGRVNIDGGLALCVGNEHTLGCARQIGVEAGCIPPAEADGMRTHMRAALDRTTELEHELSAVKAQLEQAQAETMQVVSIEDLKQMLVDGAAPAS